MGKSQLKKINILRRRNKRDNKNGQKIIRINSREVWNILNIIITVCLHRIEVLLQIIDLIVIVVVIDRSNKRENTSVVPSQIITKVTIPTTTKIMINLRNQ